MINISNCKTFTLRRAENPKIDDGMEFIRENTTRQFYRCLFYFFISIFDFFRVQSAFNWKQNWNRIWENNKLDSINSTSRIRNFLVEVHDLKAPIPSENDFF